MPSFSGLGLGSQLYAGLKKEGTRLTAELVPDITLKIESNSVAPKPEYDVDRIQYMDRQNVYDKRISKMMVDGEIVARINNSDIGAFLFFAFGSGGYSATTASGATTHVYTPQNKISTAYSLQLPSFTLFYSRGAAGNYYKANGCQVDSLKVEFGETESKVTISIMGLTETEVTNSTERTNIDSALSYSTATFKFYFGMLTAKYAANVSGLSSGTTFKVKPGVNIEIKNNLKPDFSSTDSVASYLVPRDFYAGVFEASVSLSEYVRDDVMYDAFMSCGFKAWEFKLNGQGAGGTELGTSSGLYPLIKFVISKATPNITSFDSPLDDAISHGIELTDLQKTSSEAYSIQVTLQNESTTYAA